VPSVRTATLNAAAARGGGRGAAGSGGGFSANPYGTGVGVDRLFREHIDIYARVGYSKRSATTALVKIALKARARPPARLSLPQPPLSNHRRWW
jgi:hypothetical protein